MRGCRDQVEVRVEINMMRIVLRQSVPGKGQNRGRKKKPAPLRAPGGGADGSS